MTELRDFFKAVSKEKHNQHLKDEELISSSFEDFFIKPLKEEISPKPVKKEVFTENTLLEKSLGLLAEPTTTKNSDPLTPLNQNFLTVEAFQKHLEFNSNFLLLVAAEKSDLNFLMIFLETALNNAISL
jgi:hypothetical protein